MLKSTAGKFHATGDELDLGQRLQTLWILLLPISLIGFYFYNRPFACQLVQVKVDTSMLTSAQKFNVEKAARKLDGVVLKPGQQFSFNGAVGPRTPASGYLDAPTYVADGSASTAGGGICVVSSALYQAALLCDLPIKERAAHMKVMQTVKPGLDATVWYGGADLKFINKYQKPVEIDCITDQSTESLTVKLMSEQKVEENAQISTREFPGNNSTMAVEVYKQKHTEAGSAVLVSRDLYRTSLKATADSKTNHASH
jgi:vancomycin resistance protein VanW